MKRISILIGGIFLASGVAAIFVKDATRKPPALPAASTAPASPLIAAAGRVEPVSEEVTLASQMPGRLAAVPVEEGDRIRRGQVVATLVNEDYRARVQYARAQLQLKEAELRRLLNGTRDQERREAEAAVVEAKAVMENARAEMERRRTLHQSGDLSRSEFERAEREFRVAQARVEAASQRSSFVSADARDDERLRAEAEVASAAAQVREAQAMLEKTIVRSPLTGVVLRKHRRAGESVSDSFDTPIVTVADNSRLRVRMDVDETDVAKIQTGQKVYVTADAYGDRKFWGEVVRVGRVLGRKNVRTEEPTERVDTKILETLVDLEDASLPAGLRVNAYVVVN